ncbi:MAG: sulfite exporter TauE/SafE family protein [Firmicutes bacterium]|nr:sulfite exporter TauE/SafE family protein [Bacillota bacterium]
MTRRITVLSTLFTAFIFLMVLAQPVFASSNSSAANSSTTVWWIWPLLLFVVTLAMGIVAVLGGVGGGVLFTPIVGSFFPFGMDFVRAAGLLVALSGALAAGPGLLKKGLADLRLAIPVALIASAGSIGGAMLGLWVSKLPGGKDIIQVSLGVVILAIVLIMLMAKKSEFPEVKKADKLSTALKITGVYHEPTTNQSIDWKIHRTPTGLFTFIFIGLLAGMFGLGAGWANVPVLNLLMGAPLKISVATSKFLLSITDTSAAWVYINSGAAIPMIIVPSIIGIMLGSFIGVKLLTKTKPNIIKIIVIFILIVSGSTSILKGLHIMK